MTYLKNTSTKTLSYSRISRTVQSAWFVAIRQPAGATADRPSLYRSSLQGQECIKTHRRRSFIALAAHLTLSAHLTLRMTSARRTA